MATKQIRWEMWEACLEGECDDCAEERAVGNGVTVRCACDCHNWDETEPPR